MNIGFVFTNFNNSLFTREAVKSLEDSPCSDNYFIVIIDNKSEQEDVVLLQAVEVEFPRVKIIYNQENMGYFSGLNIGIRYLRQASLRLDCIVVGNNDLVFPADFYDALSRSRDKISQYAVVSPDLITLDGVHQNPHVKYGISSMREFIYDLYYSNYFLALIISWVSRVTHKITKRKDYKEYMNSGVIHMGYGACYILTPVFFKYFKELWSPTFLMGEEFFLMKQLHDEGLKIFYDSGITIEHHDHATISKVPGKKLWEMSRASHLLSKTYK